jgi:hypothetical protein
MSSQQPQASPAFISKGDLARRWGRSTMFINRLAKSDPDFPEGMRFGTAANAWVMFPMPQVENYEKLCAARAIPARKVTAKKPLKRRA